MYVKLDRTSRLPYSHHVNDSNVGPRRTASEWRHGRRYVFEFGAALIAFIVLAIVADRAGPGLTGASRVALTVAPATAALGMALAVARFVLCMDELQRATVLTAGAIAALATGVVAMALGLLQDAHIVDVSMTVILPLLALFWGIALALVRRTSR